MSEKPDGGSAFPSYVEAGEVVAVSGGMTMRGYFAAQAAQGFVMAHTIAHGPDWTPDGIAATSYAVADAMLAEREK